jgi:hypothetical protein
MNKKIIGYKLIKPEYEQAVDKIVLHTNSGTTEYKHVKTTPLGGYSVTLNPESIKNLKEAGVLDLWFEPIYEEEVIPEYVECIQDPEFRSLSDVKVGTIWKTCNKGYPTGKYRIVWSDGSGQNTIGKEHCFKPSTLEAYNAQNQIKTEQIFTKEQKDYIKNLINNEIKKLQ